MPHSEPHWLGWALLAFALVVGLSVWGLLCIRSLRGQCARYDARCHDLAREIARLQQEKAENAQRLAEALVAHDGLTREFHHRVKNALQIIQSYLTLSRRHKTIPQNSFLAEAEVKVQVISTAYRLALNDGEIKPISMQAFILDIIENAQTMLRLSQGGISLRFDETSPGAQAGGHDRLLVLDRAIPLGLAIIEVMTSALGVPTIMHIDICIRGLGQDQIALTIAVDDVFAQVPLPVRLMNGLRHQLDASAEPCTGNEILHWHVPH